MNPTRRRIPNSETRIASSTKPVGPSFSIPLKMNPITQSETGIDLTLSAILTSYVTLEVLAGGELIAQTTSESVGRKAPDLIDVSKIFAAHSEEKDAGDATLEREAKFGPARWRPAAGTTQESSTSASHVQCP